MSVLKRWNGSDWEKIGPAVENTSTSTGSGITEEIKQALLQLASKVAYIDENGQTYYNGLYNALYNVAVSSITAVYTQSGTVYTTDSLDSLRDDLVVTANYVDGTSNTVTAYTLSGTLTEGTSTITVSYGGKTDTFNVTVTLKEFDIDIDNSGFAVESLRPVTASSYNSDPYYYSANNRYSYHAFDLMLYGGKTYLVTATVNYQTAQMGLQFFNQVILDAVEQHSPYQILSNEYDPGWQSLTTTVSVPVNQNNSPIRGVRLTFRVNTSNASIPADFEVIRVTFKEVTE